MGEQLTRPAEQLPADANYVILYNTQSKHADEALRRIRILERMFPRSGQVDRIESHPDLEQTRLRVHQALVDNIIAGWDPVLVVAGGDGTINMALQTLVSSSTPTVLRNTLITPLGTGNANDLAHMLFHDPADMDEVFKRSHVVDIHPLQFQIVPPGKDPADPAVLRIAERHIAGNYVSFGASAHGARELNKKSVRKQARGETDKTPQTTWERALQALKHKTYGQHVADFKAIEAAVQAPPFRIEHEGEEITIREILFVNGDRAAKLGKTPARLHKPEFFAAMIRDERFGRTALAANFIKMMLNKMPGKVLQNPVYTFKVLEDVPVQYDGETTIVHAGSTIIVSHSDMAFRALTSRLHG